MHTWVAENSRGAKKTQGSKCARRQRPSTTPRCTRTDFWAARKWRHVYDARTPAFQCCSTAEICVALRYTTCPDFTSPFLRVPYCHVFSRSGVRQSGQSWSGDGALETSLYVPVEHVWVSVSGLYWMRTNPACWVLCVYRHLEWDRQAGWVRHYMSESRRL